MFWLFMCEFVGVFFPHGSYEKIRTVKCAYLHLRVRFVMHHCMSSTNPPSVQRLPVVFDVEGMWTIV